MRRASTGALAPQWFLSRTGLPPHNAYASPGTTPSLRRRMPITNLHPRAGDERMTTVARMTPTPANSTAPSADDPPAGFPQPPLLAEEGPPVLDYGTRTLLDFSPVTRR